MSAYTARSERRVKNAQPLFLDLQRLLMHRSLDKTVDPRLFRPSFDKLFFMELHSFRTLI